MENRGHALARDELIRVLTAYSGITTADGAANGTTLIDSNLIGRNNFVTGKTILIMFGNARDEDLGAVGFAPGTGTITVEPAGFSAQIVAGTIFRILNISSVETKISAIIALLSQVSRPKIELYEGWQDELGIDFTLWTVVNPATPPAWARGAGTGVMAAMLRATAAPQANEEARLVGDQRWPIAPNIIGTNTILRMINLEFEMSIANLVNLDPARCFFGFTPNQADVRTNQNIIGFALIGANALQTVTDRTGAEEVHTGFLENLANLNKFRIVVLSVGAVRTVQFYLNETLIASHVIVANLPDLPMYPNWYFDTTNLGACTPQIGIVRIWAYDYQIP